MSAARPLSGWATNKLNALCLAGNSGNTPIDGASQTNRWTVLGNDWGVGSTSAKATANTYTWEATDHGWAMVGVTLNEVAASAGAPVRRRVIQQ